MRPQRKPPTPRAVATALRISGGRSGYSITVEERDARLDDQGHRCAVCRRPFRVPPWHLICIYAGKVAGRRINRLMVDHDHRTGLVRGLLCNWCNRNILPLLDDHPDVMTRALAYRNAGGWPYDEAPEDPRGTPGD